MKKSVKHMPLLCYDVIAMERNNAKANRKLPIGGFLKQSLIDYPGYISSVIFTQGCQFRCSYCHNPELVYPRQFSQDTVDPQTILNWVARHKNMLDAIVISGGEPTMHIQLPDFMRQVKDMGLEIKLDTNGTAPDMLMALLEEKLIDYIAMDIKAPLHFESYRKLAGTTFKPAMMDKIIQSVDLLQSASISHEFRTTLDKRLSTQDIEDIAKRISGPYYLQKVRSAEGCIQPSDNVDVEMLMLQAPVKYPNLTLYLR